MPKGENQGLRFRFLAGAIDLFGIADRAAASAADEASLSEKEIRDRNLVAIVFAALSVEAFLNELATLDYWASTDNPSAVALDSRLKALQRVLKLAEEGTLQAPGKLQLAHEILGHQLETGQQPFQDYRLLKQLRDSVVHSKPTSVEIRGSPLQFHASRANLLRALQTRGLLSRDPARAGRGFLDWLDNRNLAQWATQAASGVVLQTIEALPEGDFKEATALFYMSFSRKTTSGSAKAE